MKPFMWGGGGGRGCKLKFAVAGFRRQNIGRIGDLLKFQIKCKFRDGTDSFTGPYLIDLLTAIKDICY